MCAFKVVEFLTQVDSHVMRCYGVSFFLSFFSCSVFDFCLLTHCRCKSYCWSWSHTKTDTVGRNFLDDGSVRYRYLYLTSYSTHLTDIHAPIGIRSRSKRAAADPRLRPRGYENRLWLNLKSSLRVLRFVFFRWERRWMGSLMKLTCIPYKRVVLGWGAKYRWVSRWQSAQEENILRIKTTYGTSDVMNVRFHGNLFIVPVRAA
jgi:hypothetical protein